MDLKEGLQNIIGLTLKKLVFVSFPLRVSERFVALVSVDNSKHLYTHLSEQEASSDNDRSD